MKQLDHWYQSSQRKPLLIRGARQVGKTTLVELFCIEYGFDLIKVNLEQTPLRTVEKSFDVEDFLIEVGLVTKKNINEKSILFLDEIQVSPKSIVMLRYLYEQRPNIPIIAAGSLLEFVLNNFPYSIPVGRITYFYLGPMSFEEYLWAIGETQLAEQIGKFPILETTFLLFEKKYREYLFVGGMPAAIQAFIKNKNPELVRQIHRNILATYKDDINKYTKGSSSLKTSKVLDRITGFIGRKFKFSEFLADYPSRDIKKSLELLSFARVIHFCYHTNASGLPIRYQSDESVFKIYFLDVGLYNTDLGTSWESLIHSSGDELLNKGIICEQFIAQHLAYRSQGLEAPELYYWLKDKKVEKAEVDFIITQSDKIIPIEVKAGATGHLKSLAYFNYEKQVTLAYRFDLRQRETDYKLSAQIPIMNQGEKKVSQFVLNNWPLFFITKI